MTSKKVLKISIFEAFLKSDINKNSRSKNKTIFLTSHLFIFLFIILSSINFTGCCAYSFTGASVPSHLKSIAIPTADDKSGSGEPGLREMLTDNLTQKFIDDNTLQVTNKNNADALLNCVITSLNDAPAVVAAGESVTTRRITINVQVTYTDLVEHKTIFSKSFSNYGDYAADKGVTARSSAINVAIDNISEDILLDVVSGW